MRYLDRASDSLGGVVGTAKDVMNYRQRSMHHDDYIDVMNKRKKR